MTALKSKVATGNYHTVSLNKRKLVFCCWVFFSSLSIGSNCLVELIAPGCCGCQTHQGSLKPIKLMDWSIIKHDDGGAASGWWIPKATGSFITAGTALCLSCLFPSAATADHGQSQHPIWVTLSQGVGIPRVKAGMYQDLGSGLLLSSCPEVTLNLLKTEKIANISGWNFGLKSQEIPSTWNPESRPDVSPLFGCRDLHAEWHFLFCLPNNDKTKRYKQNLAPDVLPSLATSLANAISSVLCFRVVSQHQQVRDTLMGSPPLLGMWQIPRTLLPNTHCNNKHGAEWLPSTMFGTWKNLCSLITMIAPLNAPRAAAWAQHRGALPLSNPQLHPGVDRCPHSRGTCPGQH